MFFLFISLAYGDTDLTEEEQDWLDSHPVIRFAGDPEWPPIDYLDGIQKGLGIDYLKYIEDELGIVIEYVQYDSWSEILNAIENKQVDMVLGSYHESRESYLTFSHVIIDIPYVVITRSDYLEDVDLTFLHNKQVATVEGWVFNTIIQETHPGIETVPYPSVADALKAVSFGEEDIFIQELASVSYEIEVNKITNLKYVKEYPQTVDVRFLIRKDYDELRQLIDKVLMDMPQSKKNDIYNDWIKLDIESFYEQPMFYVISVFLLVVSLLVVFWFKLLRRQIRIKTQALQDELNHKEMIQKQLEEAIEKEKEIKREMIVQERLASLGSMVAGISHEVNNPLGICLTSTSAFRSKLIRVKKDYESDHLKKNQFDDFMIMAEESAQIIESNLNRAIQTINGFKNMAVDQLQDGKEMIDFCLFINNHTETMKYELKKKQVKVEIICSDNLYLLGDVGALTQIFTNLMINSLVHGFVNDNKHLIKIKAALIERTLVIEYSDNGVGIPEDIVDQVFKLFFTTKKKQGGSGIGLHIVKHLLDEKFDGRITCDENPGGGVMFTLHIPIRNH